MSMKVAINGFGRIGRLFLRAAAKQRADIEVVAVNDLTDAATLAHLLKYDSVHKVWPGEVTPHRRTRSPSKGAPIKVLSASRHQAAALARAGRGRGHGVHRAATPTGSTPALHLDQGAKKVIISAPAKDPDITVVMGVNDQDYDPARHDLVSTGVLHHQLPGAAGRRCCSIPSASSRAS